jgi:hypothetical protein
MSWLSKAWNAVTGTIKAIISNPVTAIAAVALAIYAPALGLRMLATMMVSSVLNAVTAKDNPDGSTTAQAGNTQVIPARTTNKIPAVYGKAFLSPILVDAKISTDNQTMWYVGALCEAPTVGSATVSFGKILWDGSTAEYDTSTGRVSKLTNAAGQEDTKIADNLWIYFFNGSTTPLQGTTQTAYQILQDTKITEAARWKGTEKMNNTIFVVMKIVYSSDDGVTGLPGNLQFETNIYQNGVTDGYRPGSAMMDYLTNPRFGAGLKPTDINTQSFIDLDTYADQVITFTPVGGGSTTQPRYRFNGMIDPTASIMSNWQQMAQCSDAFIQYNESVGKWSVITNKAYDQLPGSKTINDLFLLDPNNIIGGINITPLDLNNTPNSVESVFYNYKTNGQQDTVYADTPQSLQNKFEPPQRLTMNYAFVNDYVRCQYLSNRKLEQCRADYIVDLTTDYSAITVDAGDIVLLTYQPFGGGGLSWTNKPFRVTQVQEQRTDDGSLTCKLQLSEYSSVVYDNFTIQDYTPPLSNYVVDPGLLAKPDAPTIPSATILKDDDTPSFVVKAKIPESGITAAIEFWYGPTEQITDNNYKLYETQYNSAGSQYPISTPGNPVYESIKVAGMPAGTMYWRVRVIGLVRKSEFSDPVELIWSPKITNPVGSVSGKINPSNMIDVIYTNGQTMWPNNTRGVMPAGGTTIVGQNTNGSVHVFFSTSVYAATNPTFNLVELWKSSAYPTFTKKAYSIRHSYDATPLQQNATVLQAVGLNYDFRSIDGGYTWSEYNNNSTSKTLTASIPYFQTSSTFPYQTAVVGPWQNTDNSYPESVNAGYRNNSGYSNPVPIKFTTTPGGTGSYKISGGINDIAVVSNTAGTNGYRRASIAVGDNGAIYFYRNGGANVTDAPVSFTQNISTWTKETTGVLKNLYSVYGSAEDYTAAYTCIVVGQSGQILKSNRQNYSSTEVWSAKSAVNTDNSDFTNTLYSVACNEAPALNDLVWVACGTDGSIITSTNNGETWYRYDALDYGTGEIITEDLRSVRYGGGNWVICGDNGTIITSTDGIGWYKIPAPTGYETRNFYSVEHSSDYLTFVIGGDGVILVNRSDLVTDFSVATGSNFSPDETLKYERLWYRGSLDDVMSTGTAATAEHQLQNGATVSSTIIDTQYTKGTELGYYLVIGSLKGDANQVVKCGGSVLSAVEYKNK